MEPMTTKSAIGIEDRSVVAKRIFDALCAQYPEKYITLIQPRGVARRRSSVAPQDRAQSRHQMSLNGSGDKCLGRCFIIEAWPR